MQEQANETPVLDDRPRRQTAFLAQIIAERLEDLLMRRERWRHRWRDHARLAKHRQQTLQRCPLAWPYGLPLGSMPKIPLHHIFVEICQLPVAVRGPVDEIAEQFEGLPYALGAKPVPDKTRRIELKELPVGATLQAPKQSAPAQIRFCCHHRLLRC
jgi:hypothetical protein